MRRAGLAKVRRPHEAPRATGSGPGELRASRLADPRGLALLAPHMDALALAAGGEVAGRMAVEQLASGGKRLRARLALACSELWDVAHGDALAWAAAVELLHNATLVHDDIEDGDRMRRGRPTLWSVHGVAQALNAGDLMLMLPLCALATLPSPLRGELALALAEHAVRTVRGQAAELDLLPAGRLDWASYHAAVAGKTGALLALPVHGAALLAGRSATEAARLAAPFVELGVLFQLQDDALDLYGDKGRGCVGSDIYEGKVSALVVEHLARRPDDTHALTRLLAAPRACTTATQVAATIAAFRGSGALAAVQARIAAISVATAEAPALRDEPELRALALELAALATASIAHLDPASKERVA